MSISSFTMVTMLDSRPAPMTIAMPLTTDIPNRIISFKDIYGSAVSNNVILVTRNGDVFEDGSFSTFMSNSYDTITFHAGLPNRWHRIAGTNIVGGQTASSTFTNFLSTNNAYIGTLSSASIYGKFYGDASQICNIPTTFTSGNFSSINISQILSACNVSTNVITACNVSTNNMSTVFAVLCNASTLLLGVGNTANINNLNAGSATFNSMSTVTSAILNTLTVGTTLINNTLATSNTTTLASLSVTGSATFAGLVSISNTVSTNFITASNISTSMLSTTSMYASSISFGYTPGPLSSFAWNIDMTVTGLSTSVVSSILITASNVSTNNISSVYAYLSIASTTTLGAGSAYFNKLTAGFITASNVSTNNISTNLGFFSTVSSLSLGAPTANISTNITGFTIASNVSTNFISSGQAYIGILTTGTQTVTNVILTTLSVNTISTFFVDADYISTNSISTNFANIIAFSTLSLGAGTANITSLFSPFTIASNVSTNFISSGQAYIGILTTGTQTGSTVTTTALSVNTISAGVLYASNVSTNSISTVFGTVSNISTVTLGAGTAYVNTLYVSANTFTTFNNTGTGTISSLTVNNGTTISNILNVGGATSFQSLTTNCNFPVYTNNVNLSRLSSSYISASNISTFSISSINGYFSILSTNTMDSKAINISSLTFYDGTTLSAGTFNYSTNINLAALPNTSLLYFNNFIIAGAYVWPGQTITALNYGLSCNASYSMLYTNESFGNGSSNINNFYIVSNAMGGTGPYYLIDTSAGNRTLAYYGILYGGSDGKSSTDALGFGLINGRAGTGGCNLFLATTTMNFSFRLRDSSYPVPLNRTITFTFTTSGAGTYTG